MIKIFANHIEFGVLFQGENVSQNQKVPVSKDFFDISPEISSNTAVFPGDTVFTRTENLSFSAGNHLDLSEVTSTVHIGAHTDAPSHYHPEGESIDQRDLKFYIGPCQVMTVKVAPGDRISPDDLPVPVKAPRVLFRTNSFPDPNKWNQDFNSLGPSLIDFLNDRGVRLVGIDTPSVDPADDQKLSSHKAIYQADMAILEGIVLTDVPDGQYHLIALPLKIKGADASPVRAILLPLEEN